MLIRKNIFKKFEWLNDKKRPFIISADYDGLICSAFLSHFLNWEMVGYYNMEKIWISKEGIEKKNDLIWVDLNIVPKSGKSIGGHIAMIDNKLPKGLKTSCNPNILLKLENTDFSNKYPLSTVSFLMWLFNVNIPVREIAKFLILHSDSTWLKYQKYPKNFDYWISILDDYDWNKLFKNINTVEYENKIDQIFYPMLIQAGANSGFSKLASQHLAIKSREYKLNPDWDEDIILNLFDMIGKNLLWTPPKLPLIYKKICGNKNTVSIDEVRKKGLNQFIEDEKVFSYAITNSKTIKYTVFDKIE